MPPAATPTRCSRTAIRIFPVDARRGEARNAAHQLRDLHLQGRHDRQAVHRRVRRRGEARRATCSWSSTPWVRARSRRSGRTVSKAAGVKIGEFGADEVVHARGAELPDAPQDPRRGRAGRVHRRRRPRRPVGRECAGQGALARHDGARSKGPVARLMEGAFSENFAETLGPVTPIVDPPAQIPAEPLDSAMVLRSSPTGGSNDLKRLYLLVHRRRAPHPRHLHAVLRDRRIERLGARRGAPPRRARPRPRRRGPDRRKAGEIRQPACATSSLMDAGIEIYEYQPTMMHAKAMVVDGVWSMVGSANFDNRSLELNDEMNVAVSDRGPGRAPAAGLRAGPQGPESSTHHLAPAFVPREGTRALLGLIW